MKTVVCIFILFSITLSSWALEILNGPRTMAEWEELDGILIAWDRLEDNRDIQVPLIEHASQEVKVYLVCNDSLNVEYHLNPQKANMKNIVLLYENYNSIWCRDYGPWTVYRNLADSLSFVDWIYEWNFDDRIPAKLSLYFQIPSFEFSKDPYKLYFSGGNFMVDGHGTGFASRELLYSNITRNEGDIDAMFDTFMGVKRFIKLETLPDDPLNHIDMYMKLLDEETLLVGEFPEFVESSKIINRNIAYIQQNFGTCFGRPYKIVRIPMAPFATGSYFGTDGQFQSYTNSLIVNKTVIVPTYNHALDAVALDIYREAMPGYNVVGINCETIIHHQGAIHCITKEIGAREPIFISHAKLQDQSGAVAGYPVQAVVKSRNFIVDVAAFYRTSPTGPFRRLTMKSQGQEDYAALIPAQPPGSTVEYYVQAMDVNDKTIRKPLVAPQGFWTFDVDMTTQVAAQPLPVQEFELLANYPNPFNSSTLLSFVLPSQEFVSLHIFDINGRLVRNVAHQEYAAGQHAVIWDGTDDANVSVGSGTYFYKLQAGDEVKQGRMSLLK